MLGRTRNSVVQSGDSARVPASCTCVRVVHTRLPLPRPPMHRQCTPAARTTRASAAQTYAFCLSYVTACSVP
eukprot:scaffold12082_cov70-Phaeocystis_antarctica.AAC.2